MADDKELCFICEKMLSKGKIIVVKAKGLDTFRQCSRQRSDGKSATVLSNRQTITVHDACRNHYINPKLIAVEKRRGSEVPPKDMPSTSRRSIVPDFDFKSHCFLCAVKITEEYLMKQKKKRICDRDEIYEVRSITMKDILVNRSRQRSDDWGRTVTARIACVADLVAEKSRYHNSCMIKFYQVPRPEKKRGYRPAENVDEAMECIYAFLEENSSECQFTLQELINSIEGDYRPDVRTIQSRLLNRYGDDIMIAVRGSRTTIVCFRNTGYKVLSEAWYNSKKKDNPQEDRLRIVREAAAIVLQDIRSRMYELNEYPPTDDFLRDVDTVIPETLCALMEALILKHKRGVFDKWHLKCTAIAHAIISAARPNSFLSALQIGVGVFLYKKFGSRQLLDVLSNLGYSASYAETLLFETSAIKRGPMNIATEAFSQFVFDNADFNTNTLDGLNTFHAMGGIQCVTPRCAVASDQAIPRLTKIPPATIVGQFGNIPIQIFRKSPESGLTSIPIEDLQTSHPIENTILPTSLDLLWLYGKSQNLSHLPGWNGFMEEATAEKPFKRSQIICLPFITAPPSDYDIILTSILSALEQCKSLKQETCFVTFDQPLYIKARDIIANNSDRKLKNVVPIVTIYFHASTLFCNL